MNMKTLTVALILAAILAAPTRAPAAETAETSQIVLPAVSLVAGMIGGKIIGSSMGIAAFGTAISGKVPGAIIGALIVPALTAQLAPLVAAIAPPTLSLADSILIVLAIARVAIQLTGVTWEDVVETVTYLARRFGSAIRWAANEFGNALSFGATVEAAEPSDEPVGPPVPEGAWIPGDTDRTTVVEFRTIANPGGLVPDLAPVQETWKGQPVR